VEASSEVQAIRIFDFADIVLLSVFSKSPPRSTETNSSHSNQSSNEIN
jgi:hypothetical protein